MKKIKEFSKKYLIGFTLGLISAGIVVVYAETYFPSNQTTYDNSNTGMSSTNVQGALDELYTTCFPPAGEQIIEDNNLEKDQYECRYFYKGANPNNYITFNNEPAGWRIISIGCDNTIKIMRNDSIGNIAWDTSSSYGSNNWNRPASLNTYLNSTYYNSLTSTAQSQIVETSYYAGAVTEDNSDLADQINDEKSRVSNVKVALPTVSEYLRTNSNADCKTFKLYNLYDHIYQYSTWMFNSDDWWTMSPNYDDSRTVFKLSYLGNVNDAYANNSPSSAVRPVVTLSSSVKITSGDGSQSNPYTIS